MRHPIYLGYLITHVAFVVRQSDWPGTYAVLAAADVALILRAGCEEQTLAKDRTYREYMTRVRWPARAGGVLEARRHEALSL